MGEEVLVPAVPRDAASVILLRDSHGGGALEVLMVRRSGSSDFAASMHVFPGGVVEEHDCGEKMAALCTGLDIERAAALLPDASSPERALGIMVAGIRETFEETGILLAGDRSGRLLSYRKGASKRFTSYRRDMKEGRISFREMLEREGLRLALDRLVYFAHWITPEVSPVRYDTRFFLALAPPGQDARHDEVETTGHFWIGPSEALERCRNGELAMLPPTVANLMALTRFSRAEEALAWADGRDVPVVTPRVSLEGGRVRLILPGDVDFA